VNRSVLHDSPRFFARFSENPKRSTLNDSRAGPARGVRQAAHQKTRRCDGFDEPRRVCASEDETLRSAETRLSSVKEGAPGGFFKLAEPVVARTAERQFKGDFATFKDVLEARA